MFNHNYKYGMSFTKINFYTRDSAMKNKNM